MGRTAPSKADVVGHLATLSPYRRDHLQKAARFPPEILEEIAQDHNLPPDVRGVAAGALGLRPTPNSVAILLRLAENANKAVWESAAAALGRLAKKDQAARAALMSLVGSSNEVVRDHAVVQLTEVPEMRDALWEAIQGDESALTAFLLTARPQQADFQRVEALLQHPAPRVREHACDWFANYAHLTPSDVRRRVIAQAERQMWRERGTVVSAMVRMLDAMRKVEETSGARNAC